MEKWAILLFVLCFQLCDCTSVHSLYKIHAKLQRGHDQSKLNEVYHGFHFEHGKIVVGRIHLELSLKPQKISSTSPILTNLSNKWFPSAIGSPLQKAGYVKWRSVKNGFVFLNPDTSEHALCKTDDVTKGDDSLHLYFTCEPAAMAQLDLSLKNSNMLEQNAKAKMEQKNTAQAEPEVLEPKGGYVYKNGQVFPQELEGTVGIHGWNANFGGAWTGNPVVGVMSSGVVGCGGISAGNCVGTPSFYPFIIGFGNESPAVAGGIQGEEWAK